MRNFYALLGDVVMDAIGHAAIFRAEHKTVAEAVFGVPIAAGGFCGKKPDSVEWRGFVGSLERLPIAVVDDVEAIPIVHSRAFEARIGYDETERMD